MDVNMSVFNDLFIHSQYNEEPIKAKNLILHLFNIRKYSAYEVKASLFPLSLAPLLVGSCIITSTETENRECL